MAQRFFSVVSGVKKLIEAITTSAGAGDAGKIPALDGSGRLSSTMMPVGIGADTALRAASETLAAGNLVQIWNDAGTAKVRKADASAAGKEATGFVLAGANVAENATVYFEGTITGLSGLTPGARYYLSDTTPGAVTDTAPSATGAVIQYIGRAISATELSFEPDDGVELA